MDATNSKSKEEIESYYDQYVKRQSQVGVNARHRSIINFLKKQGISSRHLVLEVGCGIGTLTSLIAQQVSNGSVVACDISPDSIEFAQKFWSSTTNVQWQVTDMANFTAEQPFDYIVLPDVLEHIPVDQHPQLFKTLRAASHDHTLVVAHFPHPKGTEWSQVHRPEKLQIVDQCLRADELMVNAYAAGFILDSFESYSLWEEPYDYQRFVLSVDRPAEGQKVKSKLRRLFTETRLKYFG